MLLNLPTEGYSPAECLDFDWACIDFDEWVEVKQEEQVIVQDTGRKPGKNQTWGRKYQTMDAIFAEFGKQDDRAVPTVTELRQQAVDDEAMVMDFWSDDE